MLHKAWNSKGEMPYLFPRSSVKFQGHTVQNITYFDPNWAFPDYRPVAAFKSLRFALFIHNMYSNMETLRLLTAQITSITVLIFLLVTQFPNWFIVCIWPWRSLVSHTATLVSVSNSSAYLSRQHIAWLISSVSVTRRLLTIYEN